MTDCRCAYQCCCGDPDADVNLLMARCAASQAAWAASPKVESIEEFQVIYYPNTEEPWYVGFYCDHQGKVTEQGTELDVTLLHWLEDNEHGWKTLG